MAVKKFKYHIGDTVSVQMYPADTSVEVQRKGVVVECHTGEGLHAVVFEGSYYVQKAEGLYATYTYPTSLIHSRNVLFEKEQFYFK